MLNTAQVIFAFLSILGRARFLGWNSNWVKKYSWLTRWIYEGNWPAVNLIITDINAIMCLERFAAIKFPFKYKIICTKKRIYGTFIVCALYAIILSYIPSFVMQKAVIKPCKLIRLSGEEYMTKCWQRPSKMNFYPDFRINFFYIGIPSTYIISISIPLFILILFGTLTLFELKRSKLPQLNKIAAESNISESIVLKREKREQQLSKLILGLVFINIFLNFVQILDWVYQTQFTPISYKISLLIGHGHIGACVRAAFFLAEALVFLMNPVCYIVNNSTVRKNIKLFCRYCRK